MALKMCKANSFTAGDRKVMPREPNAPDIKFRVHKFTPRQRPVDKGNVVIFPIFSEFGCETLATVYCLPMFLQKHCVGKYSIVMGWHGRAYLYRHLVDEFWELPEDRMWLREYCRAFHHVSKNLRREEKNASAFGHVVAVSHLGNVAVFPVLQTCPHQQCAGGPVTLHGGRQRCPKCKTLFPEPGLFSDFAVAKKRACWLPRPSEEKVEYVKKYLPPRAVGVTARNRKTYGRNLESIFYERLIYLLEDLGYSPVWIGEKVTSLPCPIKRIPDFSSTEDAKDLEMTLALVSQMEFTIQFWTASTRLAALMGVPFILFESPDQIWGAGQEGMRLNLITRGERKLVVSHFRSVYDDNTSALGLARDAVLELEEGDYGDMIGLVENKDYIRYMKTLHGPRIGEE